MVEATSKAGVKAIQPGGSLKDEESIAMCNEKKLSMIFTGIRDISNTNLEFTCCYKTGRYIGKQFITET